VTWEQKPAPVQKCGNCGYQKIFISVYMLKCLTTSVVSYRRAVEKGENKIRCHVKLDIYTNKIWCSPVNHANICAFTVITGNLTHTSSLIK